MREGLVCFAAIAALIWMSSEGRFDHGRLPISSSSPPLSVSNLPLPDPHRLDSLSIVPAAQAAPLAQETVYVTGSLVNIRSGPGLSYRMLDVVEKGAKIKVAGDRRGRWAPVYNPETGVKGWIHSAYIASR